MVALVTIASVVVCGWIAVWLLPDVGAAWPVPSGQSQPVNSCQPRTRLTRGRYGEQARLCPPAQVAAVRVDS